MAATNGETGGETGGRRDNPDNETNKRKGIGDEA